jgi:hypothetical protein
LLLLFRLHLLLHLLHLLLQEVAQLSCLLLVPLVQPPHHPAQAAAAGPSDVIDWFLFTCIYVCRSSKLLQLGETGPGAASGFG